MRRRAGFGVLIVAGVLAGCTGEAPSSREADGAAERAGFRPVGGSGASTAFTENRPAVVRTARLAPDPVTLEEPVSVAVEAEDPGGGAVTFTHQWYVNGEPLAGQTSPTLAPDLLSRGDRVSVEVKPLNAKGSGIPHRTTEVVVANTPPTVTRVLFKPFPSRVGDRLVVEPESTDPDGDDVTHEFRWYRNGDEPVLAAHDAVDTAEFRRGDRIRVEVTPHDGIDAGDTFRSDPITIDNSPPEITSTPPLQVEGNVYTYAVAAVDRDGDALGYALEGAPSGMTIDPKTGRLRWQMTPADAGVHRVRVAVSDGHVSEPTVQEFELRLDAKVER